MWSTLQEDPVLITPEAKYQKPYVAIIKVLFFLLTNLLQWVFCRMLKENLFFLDSALKAVFPVHLFRRL